MRMVSIYSKEDGTFQVSYINPIDLKRKRKTFKNHINALNYKKDVEFSIRNGKHDLSDKHYIGNLMKLFLSKHHHSKLLERKNVFMEFCDRFNHFEVKYLTQEAVEIWLREFKHNRNLADKTMLSIKCQLNHFTKWLITEGYLIKNPIEGVKFKRNEPPKKARVILSKEEIKALSDELRAKDKVILYPYLMTLIHTGCRRSEAVNLNWEDVDFETGLINFRKTKNGDDRPVKMSPSLQGTLSNHPRYGEFVFFDKMGSRIKRHNLQRAVNQFKSESNLSKDWNCHDLRHSFAYNFLKNGGEMYQLKAILGHKTIQMTIDLYGNLKAADIERPSPYDDSF